MTEPLLLPHGRDDQDAYGAIGGIESSTQSSLRSYEEEGEEFRELPPGESVATHIVIGLPSECLG